MTLATRARYQVNAHASFTYDETRVAALYDVEDTDRRLIVYSWLTHEMAKDPAAVEATLEWMDEQAEAMASSPDDIPTATGAWT